MPPSILVLSFLAACLLLARLWFRSTLRRGAALLQIAPGYRSFFRKLGVTEPAHFLALAGDTPHIVSGHPDRHVARITIETSEGSWSAYLKCEHRVTFRTRLHNALAGFGFVSRSLREACTLQGLQREGLPAPEWLAAGEDGTGRAFLLVREAQGQELRAFLSTEKNPQRRRRVARLLGARLARLHAAGYRHPDLYAKHVFVDCDHDSICLLDWPRAHLRPHLSWRERHRDLAALHATVDDALATEEERLLCLRAYWRSSASLAISWRTVVEGIIAQTQHLLARRHIREKRQPPQQPQAWICLDGEALCVTPTLRDRCGDRLHELLRPCREEWGASATVRRRWSDLPRGGRTLLVQRKERKSALPWRLRSRPQASPEQRQAALLLRLQRHGIPAPQVLALGQQQGADGGLKSFLLTEPLSDTCSLEAWLARRPTRRVSSPKTLRHRDVLSEAGTLLQRLHDASCYLDLEAAGCGFAVRHEEGRLSVVLERVESVRPKRRQQIWRAALDVRRFQRVLRAAGCTPSEVSHFRAAYHHAATVQPSSKASPVPEKRKEQAQRKPLLPIVEHTAPETHSFWRRLLVGIRRWCHRYDWTLFAGADWPDRIMGLEITDRCYTKQGRSTGRWVLHQKATPMQHSQRLTVYLKRHYELPWWQGWLATLWPRSSWSPARQEGQHLEWARQQGLSVPRMVASAEYIGPWGKLQSVLAVQELAGMLSLQEAIPLAALRQNASGFRQWKCGLAIEMARLTRLLHDRRCFHKDLYLCHFFIDQEDTRAIPQAGWRGRIYLIDLHRLGHHPWTWKVWQTKDLGQLLYASDIVGIDARDRLLFWRAYIGYGPQRPQHPWVRRCILYRGQRYRLHNAHLQQARQNE